MNQSPTIPGSSKHFLHSPCSPAYQGFSITFASLAPVAAITYSLLYGISTKKKVIMIDTKRTKTDPTLKQRSYSIGSLEDYAELLEGEEVLEEAGYFGNMKLINKHEEEDNYKVQDATTMERLRFNGKKSSGHRLASSTSDLSSDSRYFRN